MEDTEKKLSDEFAARVDALDDAGLEAALDQALALSSITKLADDYRAGKEPDFKNLTNNYRQRPGSF